VDTARTPAACLVFTIIVTQLPFLVTL